MEMEKTMKTLVTILAVVMILAISGVAQATGGWIDTERFGYNGTITRYSDSTLTTTVGDVVQTGPRDASLWSDSDAAGSVVMGSWWYSTAVDALGNPLGSGYGNTTGNTGPGFMQYYDTTQAYVTDQQYAFSNYNGTYWTDMSFSLKVAMSAAGAYSRLSAPANTGDAGYFQSLNVNLTATGLQGVWDAGQGLVIANESDTYASGVTGTISGVFVNTSTSVPANNGYYVFSFDLNMDNWAYVNRENLVGEYDTFYVGSFAAVPEPATMCLLGLGGLLLRRKK
jgi:hypothetical protein